MKGFGWIIQSIWSLNEDSQGNPTGVDTVGVVIKEDGTVERNAVETLLSAGRRTDSTRVERADFPGKRRR